MTARFEYRVRNRAGELLAGFIEAENREAAARQLRDREYYVVELRPLIRMLPAISFSRSVKARDLAIFCRYLSAMLQAGMPFLSAFKILERQGESSKLQKAASEIRVALERGSTMADALKKYPNIFPPLMINMVEAGELGGSLDEILRQLSIHYDKEHEVNQKVKSALTYPAVVVVVSIAAVLFLVIFVLPTFAAVLVSLEVPLPFLTQVVMGTSMLLQEKWYLLLLIAVLVVLGTGYYFRREDGAFLKDKILLKMPVIGNLVSRVIASRFCRTLAILLRGGIPMIASLEVMQKVAGNRLFAQAIEQAHRGLAQGEGLAERLSSQSVFPPIVIEMISLGEETGEVDELLSRLSDFYDKEVSVAVERITSLIEPVLIVILGGFIALIIISVLLPIFSILGGMH